MCDLIDHEQYRVTSCRCMFDFTVPEWVALLTLARMYGWEPAGTISHLERKWAGDYVSGRRSVITPTDAKNLADAIDRAVPRVRELAEKVSSPDQTPHYARFYADPHVYFARHPDADYLPSFISVLRKSSAEISRGFIQWGPGALADEAAEEAKDTVA